MDKNLEIRKMSIYGLNQSNSTSAFIPKIVWYGKTFEISSCNIAISKFDNSEVLPSRLIYVSSCNLIGLENDLRWSYFCNCVNFFFVNLWIDLNFENLPVI